MGSVGRQGAEGIAHGACMWWFIHRRLTVGIVQCALMEMHSIL